MLRNYLTVAWRVLQHRPIYAAINVVGLAVGLAACFLIALFVRDELSYDDFHEKADRIYRVASKSEMSERSMQRLHQSAVLAPTLERAFPAVAEAVRINYRWGRDVLVRRKGTTFYEDRLLLTDSAFFDVFSFPFVKGNPQAALAEPFSVVLTESAAEKYFGVEDPMGQMIQARGYGEMHDLTVTGVAEDPPHNTHLSFDMLVSFNSLPATMPDPESLDSWFYVSHYTYVLLEEGSAPENIERALPELVAERGGREPREGAEVFYPLQPITDIHLHSDYDRELAPTSDVRYVWLFSALALVVLAIACINYMNLATARSAHRAQEVGVRKTLGAGRGQLARQFLGESALLCGAAFLMAFVLARLALPLFNQLTGKALSFSYVAQGDLLLGFLGVGLLVSLMAGSYPALVLSGIRPVPVLRGFSSGTGRNTALRKGLVVAQFAASVALIVATLVAGRQLRHMQTKSLGLDAEHVAVIHARDALEGSGRYYAFKQQLLQQADITGVTATNHPLPASEGNLVGSLVPEDREPDEWFKKDITINTVTVDPDFTEVMDVPVLKGRDLSPKYRSEEHMPVLINEKAAEAIGWEDPVGKSFSCCFRPTPKVVGVTSDFHYQPLRQEIEPLVLIEGWSKKDAYYAPSRILVRMQPGDPAGTLSFLEEQWGKVSEVPFAYSFLDEQFDAAYRTETRTARVFGTFAGLAVLLACLGLFGLAAYAAERRRKEIGIRKAMGASARSVVALLSKDFLKLVLLGTAVAVPLAWYGMQRWLEGFAYRIELGPWIFLAAGTGAVLVALVTTGYQAWRAARTNPADALRDE